MVTEELKVTVPTDPVSEENLLTEPKVDSDGKIETEETEKVTDPVEVVTDPCSSIVQFAADMMYNRMKEQGIPIKPFDENTAV